jgi:hypothetical protein
MKKVLLIAFSIILVLAVINCDKNNVQPPTLSIEYVKMIRCNSMEFQAHVYYEDEYKFEECGICYAAETEPNIGANDHFSCNEFMNTFKGSIKNLTPGTNYYLRPYAVYDGFVYYGQSKQVQTLTLPTPPCAIAENTFFYKYSTNKDIHSIQGIQNYSSYTITASCGNGEFDISFYSLPESGVYYCEENYINFNYNSVVFRYSDSRDYTLSRGDSIIVENNNEHISVTKCSAMFRERNTGQNPFFADVNITLKK